MNQSQAQQPEHDDCDLNGAAQVSLVPPDISAPSNQPAPSSLWIPMTSNFSTSYNVVNISMVLPILKQLHKDASSRDAAACASSLLAGMIVGQLVGGALGDSRLGRIGALRLVMVLQILASIASASIGIFSTTSGGDIFLLLAACRFVLGIGCGGVYPLAAVLSAEQGKNRDVDNHAQQEEVSNDDGAIDPSQETTNARVEEVQSKDEHDSVHRVVLTFSTQGMGFVAVPILAVILLYSTTNLDFVWRCMLGVGALPGVVLLIMQCFSSRQQEYQSVQIDTAHEERQAMHSSNNSEDEQDEELSPPFSDGTDGVNRPFPSPPDEIHSAGGLTVPTPSILDWAKTLFHEPGLGRKVLGTAGTWFLFDVVFYGNTIFQPVVISAAFGVSKADNPMDLLRKTAIDSLILTSIALPGYAVAGFVMGKTTCCITQTPRYVMLQGFSAMAVLYAKIGVSWSYLRGYPSLLVFLYSLTFFFANYGPNTTTFILPSLIFEKEHRATWNGVSAAAGKLGALTGATLFEPAADAFGESAVMIICSVVAVVACLLTFFAVPQPQESLLSPEDSDDAAFHETDGELT